MLAICQSALAFVFGDCDIRKVVAAALPSHVIVAGDHGWAGGMRSNAEVDHVFFDTNSAFFVIEPREPGGGGAADLIASKVREQIVREFFLPVAKPASLWMARQPEGTTRESYGEAYLHTFPKGNDRTKVSLYVTVQVVRIAEGRLGVTVSYVWRGEP